MMKKGKDKHWMGDFTNKNNKRLQEFAGACCGENET